MGEFQSSDGALLVDMSNGRVHANVATLLGDLNGQAPNTELISTAMVENLLDSFAEVVLDIADHAVDAVLDSMDEITVSIGVGMSAGVGAITQSGSMPISGSLLDFFGLGDPINIDAELKILGFDTGGAITDLAGGLLGQAITSVVGPVLQQVLDFVRVELREIIKTGIGTLIAPIEGVLEDNLGDILSIRVNEQPTAGPFNLPGGDLGEGSFTVRALRVTVMPEAGTIDGGLASIAFASSSVKSAEEEAVPVVITDPENGTEFEESPVAVTGTGEPGAEIVVELQDEDNNVVATGNTNVDGSGNWTVTFEDLDAGEYVAEATQDADGQISDDSVSFTVTGSDDGVGDEDGGEDSGEDSDETSDEDSGEDSDETSDEDGDETSGESGDEESGDEADESGTGPSDDDAEDSTDSEGADGTADGTTDASGKDGADGGSKIPALGADSPVLLTALTAFLLIMGIGTIVVRRSKI